MRKVTLLLIGVLMGAGASWVAMSPDIRLGGAAIAASPDTYRQLNLLGDVFERIRSD